MERPTGGLEAPRPREGSFYRGVSLGLLVGREDDDARKKKYETTLDEIAAAGATDVQLSVRWSQERASSIEITPHPTETVDDGLLAWLMRAAQERSLRLFLLPTLHIAEAESGSSGEIAPADADRWWWSYRRFVMHYARMAQAHDAALFAVGSELRSLDEEGERWRELIADVRKVYQGELTYSASSDHFAAVSFWDAVDVIGVAGPAPLPAPLPAKGGLSDEALREAFAPFARRLRKWAIAGGHRYVLTEVGHPSTAIAAPSSGSTGEKGRSDPTLRLRCQRALYDVWQADARLGGVYVRPWSGDADGHGPGPLGKPVAAVLAHWFRGSVAEPGATASKAQ